MSSEIKPLLQGQLGENELNMSPEGGVFWGLINCTSGEIIFLTYTINRWFNHLQFPSLFRQGNRKIIHLTSPKTSCGVDIFVVLQLCILASLLLRDIKSQKPHFFSLACFLIPAGILLCDKNNFKGLKFLKSDLSNPPYRKFLNFSLFL